MRSKCTPCDCLVENVRRAVIKASVVGRWIYEARQEHDVVPCGTDHNSDYRGVEYGDWSWAKQLVDVRTGRHVGFSTHAHDLRFLAGFALHQLRPVRVLATQWSSLPWSWLGCRFLALSS